MSRLDRFGQLIVSMAVVCLALPAMAQQDKKEAEKPKTEGQPAMPAMSPEEMAKWQKWMATMMPGEHHKHLEAFVGEWDITMKVFTAGPGGPAMESKGTSTVKWMLGGRYLMEELKSSMMGMPYEGVGMMGYDNYKNMYVGSWASSMDTQFITMKGMRHPTTGVFTFYGDMDEPTLDVHARTVKYETRIVDENNHVFSITDLHAGDDYKVVQIEYKRQNPKAEKKD